MYTFGGKSLEGAEEKKKKQEDSESESDEPDENSQASVDSEDLDTMLKPDAGVAAIEPRFIPVKIPGTTIDEGGC